ncbi:MAG: TIM barrel protein [Candidatus Micrarchaeota archaeon]
MERIISITRAGLPEQLRQAKEAGFTHVELFTSKKLLNADTLESHSAEAKAALKENGLKANSVVIPKSATLEEFVENGKLAIKFAENVGAKLVVADYPKYRGGEFRKPELEGADIAEPGRAARAVRGVLHVMPSPFETAEKLRELKQLAARKGLKLVIEPPGGSDIGAKPLGFKAWQTLANAAHGLVLDLEHIAQQTVVQPLEEVHNPVLRVMKGTASAEDFLLVRSFYHDYADHMDRPSKRLFEAFLSQAQVLQNPRESPARKADAWKALKKTGSALYVLVKPKLEGFDKPSPKPQDLKITPSPWVYNLFVKAWGSLPIEHVHLTGGHLGSLLTPEETVQTILGVSDKAFEHSYTIERPSGEPIYLGSKPGQGLYEYLHTKMGGRLYPTRKWHEFAKDLLRNSQPKSINFKPGANFEIDPKLVRKTDFAKAARI